jgi:acyl carrier protein
VVLLTGDVGRIRPDGYLELLGRSDSLVKIRGFRVELAAVEAAMRELDTVADVAVLSLPDATGEASVVAYVVLTGDGDVGGVRHALATRLPDYMIPSAFVVLDALPFTRSGKVDRKALPLPAQHVTISARAWQAPRTSAEEVLVSLWSDILKVDRIGVADDFFELGGHSLLAARVIAKVNEQFRVSLVLRALYDAPTVARLAALIEQSGPHIPERKTSANEAPAVEETRRLLGLS